tara:strand:+ start:1243 stop:2556 length:1314 start_codon:yes stop_codon:yes gene_type:complete
VAKVSVRKETGTLLFDFNYLGVRCREQTALKDTKANRRRMEKMLEKIEQAIVLGTFEYEKFFPGSSRAAGFKRDVRNHSGSVQDSGSRSQLAARLPETFIKNTPKFSEFAEVWFTENEAAWRVNTQKAARSHLNRHLSSKFGNLQVHSIQKSDLLGFRAELSKEKTGEGERTLTAKTVNEIMGTLLAILKEAAFRYEFKNPGETIKRLKVQKNHVDPLSLDEVTLFLESIRQDYYNYFLVRFYTGLRSGEIHGLKWENVDFGRREILVRESITNGRTEYTKNDGSQREIHMSQPVLDALSRQKAATGEVSAYVFCTSNAKPLDTKNVNARIWKPTLRLLGLKERRLYQTRHTAATLWLASGEAPEWIARQMGHTNTQMLFQTYSRYIPNLTRQDGSAFERMLSSRLPTAPNSPRQNGHQDNELLSEKSISNENNSND